MKIIDGKKIANKLNLKLKEHLTFIKKEFNLNPCLNVILVGENKASEIYVKNKQITANKVGITSKIIKTSEKTTEKELLSIVKKCNIDEISKYLIKIGKDKKFPDITLRE